MTMSEPQSQEEYDAQQEGLAAEHEMNLQAQSEAAKDEIDDVKEIDIEKIKNAAFQAGYKVRDDEALRSLEYFERNSRKEIRESYQDGLEEGKSVSVLRTIHAQPYEVESDVIVEYGAKGECKPKASVKITRYLEDGSNLSELIKADLARGVEEMMTAVSEIQKRNAGVK